MDIVPLEICQLHGWKKERSARKSSQKKPLLSTQTHTQTRTHTHTRARAQKRKRTELQVTNTTEGASGTVGVGQENIDCHVRRDSESVQIRRDSISGCNVLQIFGQTKQASVIPTRNSVWVGREAIHGDNFCPPLWLCGQIHQALLLGKKLQLGSGLRGERTLHCVFC